MISPEEALISVEVFRQLIFVHQLWSEVCSLQTECLRLCTLWVHEIRGCWGWWMPWKQGRSLQSSFPKCSFLALYIFKLQCKHLILTAPWFKVVEMKKESFAVQEAKGKFEIKIWKCLVLCLKLKSFWCYLRGFTCTRSVLSCSGWSAHSSKAFRRRHCYSLRN